MCQFLVQFGAKDTTERPQATDLWAQRFRSTADSSAKRMNIKKTIFHRITEWEGLEGPSGDHPAQPPAEAGSPTAGCRGPCPGGS